jgi:hypothetical protein
MAFDIRHDRAAHRFTTEVDDLSAHLDYTLSPGTLSPGTQSDGDAATPVMTITHTIVPPPIGGRGIAGDLVRAALGVAREEGWKVVPACSYADAWMKRHPEFADLHA